MVKRGYHGTSLLGGISGISLHFGSGGNYVGPQHPTLHDTIHVLCGTDNAMARRNGPIIRFQLRGFNNTLLTYCLALESGFGFPYIYGLGHPRHLGRF